MLLLAKIAGVIVLVWFYVTAKEKGEQPFKWATIGLIGYWLTWWIVDLSIVSFLPTGFIKNFTAVFLLAQVPALCAIGAAFLIRKKLLADTANANKQD